MNKLILEALSLVGYRTLPFGVLAVHIRANSFAPFTDQELLAGLRYCEEQGWIQRKVSQLDRTETWFLLDAGKIAMRSAQ